MALPRYGMDALMIFGWVMHGFISVCGHIHLLLCTFLMVFSFLGNLQDCKDYSEAHYC